MALRNARDLYTRRNEGVSIWVVPADAIASSDPDAKGSFFESPAGQGLPPRHVLHQERGREAPVSTTPETDMQQTAGHGDISVGVSGAGASGDGTASATRITPGNALRPEDIALAVSRGTAKPSEDVAEFALRLGDDALILAQRLGHWISRAPELEEDVALGNIALDQLGHARSFLSYAGGLDGRSEDDLAYFRREHEFRSAAALRAAQRGLRRHHRPAVRGQLLPVRALPPADRLHRRHPGRHRRQGGQGSGLPPRPQRPVGPAPGPRHGRVAPADDPRRSRSSGPTSTSCSATTSSPAASRGRRRRRSLPACARTSTGSPARSWPKPSWRSRRSSRTAAAAAAASTPNTSATSSPRCRCSPASTPEPAGRTMEMFVSDPETASAATPPRATRPGEGLGRRRHRVRPRDPGPHHRGPRHPARCPGLDGTSTDDGGMVPAVQVTITPTYSGCPAMDAIRDDLTAAFRRAGLPERPTWNWSSPRPGPPTG